MAKIECTDYIKCWQGCGDTESLMYCWWEHKMIQPLWRIVWQFLIKLNMQLLSDPAIVLLDIYPRAMKAYVYTKAYKEMP